MVRGLIGLELLRGDTSVDIEALRREVTVSFDSSNDESSYQRTDWQLHCLIQAVAEARFGLEAASTFVSVGEDWSPNKTKCVYCNEAAICAGFICDLQTLLHGPFSDWCIAIEVYKLSGGQELDIGPVRVYADAVIAVQSLASALAGGA